MSAFNVPFNAFVFKGDNCHGKRHSKDCLTLLLCPNTDGSDKWISLVIGKSLKTTCFKNIKTLPLCYEANIKVWMAVEIFIRWLRKIDKGMKKLKHKILLFMDQCAAHAQELDFLKNTKVIFFPTHYTSKLPRSWYYKKLKSALQKEVS